MRLGIGIGVCTPQKPASEEIPANAIVDRNGTPIVDRNGNYILARA